MTNSTKTTARKTHPLLSESPIIVQMAATLKASGITVPTPENEEEFWYFKSTALANFRTFGGHPSFNADDVAGALLMASN